MIQNTKFFAACLMGALLTGNSQAQIFQAPQSNAQQGARLGGIAGAIIGGIAGHQNDCLLYTSPSPRDRQKSRMPSSA